MSRDYNPYGGPLKFVVPICKDCERKDKRIAELEATLNRIKALPDKWQMSAAIAQRAGYSGLAEGKCECADELEAALEQGDES